MGTFDPVYTAARGQPVSGNERVPRVYGPDLETFDLARVRLLVWGRVTIDFVNKSISINEGGSGPIFVLGLWSHLYLCWWTARLAPRLFWVWGEWPVLSWRP